MTRRTLVALTVGLLCFLTACSGSPFSSGQQGFVSSDGQVKVVPTEDRQRPQAVSGETLDGEPVDLADLEGKVVVIPVWGQWCPPCRKEAPMFAAAARDLADDDVAFLGINSRDTSVETPRAFVRNFDIPYPSIFNPTGSLLLAFGSGLTPNSIPSVVFVDAEGRVAATVLGEISQGTLYGVIEEVSS